MSAADGTVREYYRALDAGDYDRLRALLTPEFVQTRPDLTLKGRARFIAFMRDERPKTATTHVVDAVYEGSSDVAVRGRLRSEEGAVLVRFVDVFALAPDGRLDRLWTYTN